MGVVRRRRFDLVVINDGADKCNSTGNVVGLTTVGRAGCAIVDWSTESFCVSCTSWWGWVVERWLWSLGRGCNIDR